MAASFASSIGPIKIDCKLNTNSGCLPCVQKGSPEEIPLHDEAWQVRTLEDPTVEKNYARAGVLQNTNDDFNQKVSAFMENRSTPRSCLTSDHFGVVEYSKGSTTKLRTGKTHKSPGRVFWNLSKIQAALDTQLSVLKQTNKAANEAKLTLPVLFKDTSSAEAGYKIKFFTFKIIEEPHTRKFHGNHTTKRYEVSGASNFRTPNLQHRLQEKLQDKPVCGENKAATVRKKYSSQVPTTSSHIPVTKTDSTNYGTYSATSPNAGWERLKPAGPLPEPIETNSSVNAQSRKGLWKNLWSKFKSIFCCLWLCCTQESEEWI